MQRLTIKEDGSCEVFVQYAFPEKPGIRPNGAGTLRIGFDPLSRTEADTLSALAMVLAAGMMVGDGAGKVSGEVE